MLRMIFIRAVLPSAVGRATATICVALTVATNLICKYGSRIRTVRVGMYLLLMHLALVHFHTLWRESGMAGLQLLHANAVM